MPTALRRILFPRFVRRRLRLFRHGPFARLVHHFLGKMVGREDTASAEAGLGAGALLGLLAVPGAFASILMLDKYSTFLNWLRGRVHQDFYATSASDKYLFL